MKPASSVTVETPPQTGTPWAGWHTTTVFSVSGPDVLNRLRITFCSRECVGQAVLFWLKWGTFGCRFCCGPTGCLNVLIFFCTDADAGMIITCQYLHFTSRCGFNWVQAQRGWNYLSAKSYLFLVEGIICQWNTNHCVRKLYILSVYSLRVTLTTNLNASQVVPVIPLNSILFI